MTSVELEIVQYLRQNPEAWFNRKEIARRARSREDFEADPHWAAAPLNSLVLQGVVEQNESGHYKICGNFLR